MKLNRRSFLGLIGLAPAAVLATKIPAVPAPKMIGFNASAPAFLKKEFNGFGDVAYVGTGATQSIPHSYAHNPSMIIIRKDGGWEMKPIPINGGHFEKSYDFL